MKIISIGTQEVNTVNWWHGLQVTCSNCHSVIELDTHDHVNVSAERHPGGKVTGSISCPINICSHRINFERPKK